MTERRTTHANRCLVAVPIRSFHEPKTRLAGVMSPAEREEMARRLAGGVIAALGSGDAAGLTVAVVTDDDEVERWARALGVDVVRSTEPGLDAAALAALRHAGSIGVAWTAVVHADLAAPAGLVDVLGRATSDDRIRTATAVADRHAEGTNVLVVPTGTRFAFSYGPGSFERHRSAAAAIGLDFVGVHGDDLGWDVDTPAELDWLRSQPHGEPPSEPDG